MRSLALKCLVLLLSLALVSGNARAELHLGAAPHDPCPVELDHGHNHDVPADHHHDGAGQNCCCDCLGCVSAIEFSPDLSSFLPAFFAFSIRYREESAHLTGQVLRPETGPPRPSSLS